MSFKVDKKKLVDKMNRPLTQSLFLEIGYNTDFAIYTLGEEDKEYNGKTYPSLKKLFVEHEDPTEYDFAKTYLLGWKHWLRLNDNKQLRVHFDEWREELEVSLRSTAVRSIIDLAMTDSGYQAAKFIADRGWDKRAPGRPTKEKKLQEDKINERIRSEFSEDFARMDTIQ